MDFKRLANHKWLALLAFLIIVDLYFVMLYIIPLPSGDGKLRAISTLFTFNSVILAGMGIMYQVQSTQERERTFRVHEQRREFYNQFLEYLANSFAVIKEKGDTLKPTDIITNKDYLNFHYKMAVYASPNVINAYSEIVREGKYHSKDPKWAMEKLGYIFANIRKEVGFTEGDIAVRKILSLWTTDITDPKYDELFKSLK